MSEPKTSPDLTKGIAFKLSDEDRMALLKKISKTVNKATFKPAKKNCRHCYGRGFVGYLNGIKTLPVPCRCTFVKPVLGKRR